MGDTPCEGLARRREFQLTWVLQGMRSCHCGSSHLSSAELTLRVSYNIPHHAFHCTLYCNVYQCIPTEVICRNALLLRSNAMQCNDGSCCILPMVEVYFSALRYRRLVTPAPSKSAMLLEPNDGSSYSSCGAEVEPAPQGQGRLSTRFHEKRCHRGCVILLGFDQ